MQPRGTIHLHSTIQFKPRIRRFRTRIATAVLILVELSAATHGRADEPTTAAVAGYNTYIAALESRIGHQHESRDGFVSSVLTDSSNRAKLKRGETIIDRLTPGDGPDLPGAMLHHWRGTAFVPGAKVADFERLMEDFAGYPKSFAPQIVQAKVLGRNDEGGRTSIQTVMRVKQRHVITVVMDTAYDVEFARLDAQHVYSVSHSTKISEISGAGTKDEHAMSGSEEHGFLWRLDTYWSCEERDGGLYMQIESVSLTRSIPAGLGWALKPFIESVPRESLEFTLQAASNTLRR
jgi:hypothetical protein